jgi:hypothetical protein
MPMTITTERAKDRLCLEEFELNEDAINTIATIIGITNTDILNEEERENPDIQKISKLKKDLSRMWKERQDVYLGGSDDMKRHVIERYSPIIRERLEQTRRELRAIGKAPVC